MKKLPVRALVVSAFALALASACGGGGGGSSSSTVSVAITDSASDDVESFIVEVDSIQITRLGGGVVSVLATPATVDLATLTDTSQLMDVTTVPAGTYVAAEITLDFTNASCVLHGQTTEAAILDADGNPLTGTLTLPIQLGLNTMALPINRHKLLELDFDLEQSVTADTTGNTVTVEPALVLRFDPAAPKTLVVVGELVSVNTAAGTFVGEVQTLGGVPITTATFDPGALTGYQIDGEPSVGAAGLTAFAAVPAGTWIQVYGTIDPLTPTFTAAFVEAGTGTYNGGTAIIEGHVIDRVGGPGTDPILTVIGYSSSAAHTAFQFNTTFTVTTLFGSTNVVRRFSSQAFDLDDVNVGQRVRIFGTLAGAAMDASSATSVIRLQPTRVLGFATGAIASGVLTIDIARVDLRAETAFNWPATGTPPTDPDAFTLQVGLLGTGLGIVNTTPVESSGFFPAVDDTAEDFVSSSLVNRSLSPSLVLVRNRPGGFTVTTTATSSEIQLAIANAAGPGEIAIVDQGFVGVLPLPTAPTPSIQPPAAGLTFYFLRDLGLGTVAMYVDFTDFSDALAVKISSGAILVRVAAIGQYNSTTNVIRASLASIIVE